MRRDALGWLFMLAAWCVLTGCPLAADDSYAFAGAAGAAPASCGMDPAPPGGQCPSVCSGGCGDGVCRISCTGAQVCKEAVIACPGGFACQIQCRGDQSCEHATISCPELYRCELSCHDNQACKEALFECSSGSCEITCGLFNACDSTDLKCFGGAACKATCVGTTPDVKGCNEACACETC